MAAYLEGRIVETFLPTYSAKRFWKNRQKVILDLALFPNYLFVRILPQQRGSVLGVPGVVGIVGTPHHASIVPDHYIVALRTGLALGRIGPHPTTEIGDRVRIIDGPLAGIEGVLAHIRSEFRVVISIAMIRQCISIEVSRDEIAPVESLGHDLWNTA